MYIKVGCNKQIRKTIKGWHLCVEWKDGTTSWERLVDMKESNPLKWPSMPRPRTFMMSQHLIGGYPMS
jgi:hypothetical protein